RSSSPAPAGATSGAGPAWTGAPAACSTSSCSPRSAATTSWACTCAGRSPTAPPRRRSRKRCCSRRSTAASPPRSSRSAWPNASWPSSPPRPTMPDASSAGLPGAGGFIGLGRMGGPMARRLAAAGVSVRGHDTAPRPGLADVVTFVEKAAEVADGVGAVILMLPDSNVVDAVVRGTGLLDALAPGTVLVDMGSSEPLRTRSLADEVAARGATLVDAPVSGGVKGAEAGSLTIMVGGPDEQVAAVTPLLDVLGRVRHIGPVGAGHALKALNNLMSAAHLVASSEALLAGQRFGIDPAVMLDAVNTSSGRSGSTENKWPNYVLPGTYDS